MTPAPRSGAAYLVLALLGIGYCYWLNFPAGIGPFDVARHSFVYNQYLLSMLDGRLDVPAWSIGLEGRFMNDGRVYTYYGAAPAILRLPLVPFVDLATVSVARLMIFLYCVGIGLGCQAVIQGLVRKLEADTGRDLLFWGAAGVALVWFASPVSVLSSNAEQTFEPIAVALLATVLFLLVVVKDVLFAESSRSTRLVTLAVLAGVAVHSRPNIGLGLYVATVLICALEVRAWRRPADTTGEAIPASRGLAARAGRPLAALVVLFLFGAILCGMNWARWGKLGFSMTPGSGLYGYMLFTDFPEYRKESVRRIGRFSVRRVIPNATFHVLGGYDLYPRLLEMFDVGYVRRAPPYARAAILWSLWFVGFLAFLWRFLPIVRWLGPRAPYAGAAFLGVAIHAYLILAYATVTFRYKAEFWPILFFATVLWAAWAFHKPEPARTSRGPALAAKILVVALLVWSGVYSHTQSRANQKPVEVFAQEERVDCRWVPEAGWSEECADLP